MISLGTGSSAAARSLRSQALTSGRKGVLGHEVPGQRQAVEGRQGGVHPRGDAVGERQGALHAAQEKGQKEEADAHGDARCEHVVWEGVRLDLHLSRLYTRCSLRAPPPPAPSLPHRRDHAHPREKTRHVGVLGCPGDARTFQNNRIFVAIGCFCAKLVLIFPQTPHGN